MSALTLGILIYIGWFNSRTHVGSRDSDVMKVYPAETGRPESPGENDWEQIEENGSETMDIIVDHASGSEDNAPSATPSHRRITGCRSTPLRLMQQCKLFR